MCRDLEKWQFLKFGSEAKNGEVTNRHCVMSTDAVALLFASFGVEIHLSKNGKFSFKSRFVSKTHECVGRC